MTIPARIAELYEAASRRRDFAAEAPLLERMALFAAEDDRPGVAWICHALSFLALSRRNLVQAEELIDRGLAVVGDRDARIRARLLNSRAALMIEQDQWPGAIAPLIAVSRMDAEFPREAYIARQNLAFCLLGLRDYPGALARFRDCLPLCPDRGASRAFVVLGICLASLRSGDLEGARTAAAAFDPLQEDDPRSAQSIVLARRIVAAEIAAVEERWADVLAATAEGIPIAITLTRISVQAQLGRLASRAAEALGDRVTARRYIADALLVPVGPDERLDVLRQAAELAHRDGELETTIRLQREALDSLRHDGTVGRTVAQVMERAAEGIHRQELELSAANDALSRAYASLDKLRHQLELRVEERTRALANEVRVRRRAEEAALRASDGKTRFLANMSHELRTPLNAIIGYAEILEEELQVENVSDATAIRRSGRHLPDMIDQVLELTRIDSGALDVRASAVDVEALLAGLATEGETQAGARRNRLLCALDVPGPPFRTDPARVRQIVVHLLDNATKFTEGGTITLAARRDGGQLEIRVIDTGMGIRRSTSRGCSSRSSRWIPRSPAGWAGRGSASRSVSGSRRGSGGGSGWRARSGWDRRSC